MQPAPRGQFNKHDLSVLLFHLVVGAAQGVLLYARAENFGAYTPYIVIGIQWGSEALRRLYFVG